MFCEKSVRYLYRIVCLHLSVVAFRYIILFPTQKQCYVVLSTITKSVEIQWAVIAVVQHRQR
jgi:hypothetical protein